MTVNVNDSFLAGKALDYVKLSDLAYATWIFDGTKWLPDAKYTKLWEEMFNKGYSFVSFQPDQSDIINGATGTPTNTGYSGTIFQYQGQKILANRGTNDALDLLAQDKDILREKNRVRS